MSYSPKLITELAPVFVKRNNIDQVRHILTARIDHASDQSAYIAYCNARDIFEYFLAGNTEALQQFDYLLTKEDCGLE